MRALYHFLFVLVFCGMVALLSCNTGTEPPGALNLNELKGITINELFLFDQKLYAATDKGLFKKSVNENEEWILLGLQKKDVLDLVFLTDNKILAAIKISDFSGGIPSLLLSNDGGKNWQVYMNNFGGPSGKYTWVTSLETPSKISDTVYALAGTAVTIARSVNSANNWKIVHGQWNYWGGLGAFIKNDPYHKNTIWAGGVNAFSLPVLLKSENSGKSWQTLGENLQRFDNIEVESVCYDISVFPNNNTILAAMGGAVPSARVIRKSIDGGESWKTVYNGIITYTFTHSAKDPRIIYASGRNASGTLFFITSSDFGATWEKVKMEESPTEIYVNDMVSVMKDGQEALYFATNKGVYSYTFKE